MLSESVTPFRWNLHKRQSLGGLLQGEVAPSYGEFVDDLRRCAARVLSFAGDSNIHVEPAPEPESFDSNVRKPGLRAIAEMVGEQPERSAGRRFEVRAGTREQIKAEHFPPYWRECTEDLLRSYKHICAYSCVYIERVTGPATVDRAIPKSVAWDHVYEWRNYRLATSLMNARKGEFADVLDPFAVEDGMFALDLVTYKAVYAQNQTSVMAEQLTMLPEMDRFADLIGNAEEEYQPDGPPISPLTNSFFSSWALFDACVGVGQETLGTTTMALGKAFGMHEELVRVIGLLQESRMAVYVHEAGVKTIVMTERINGCRSGRGAIGGPGR